MAFNPRRHKGLIIFLVVVVALGIFLASRWKVMFHNPAERSVAFSAVPWRVMLTPADSSATARNVSWQCDSVVRQSFVTLADLTVADTIVCPGVGEVFVSRAGRAAYYHATLRPLQAGHSYAYQVTCGADTSAWFSFSLRAEADECNVLYVGDMQDSVGGCIGDMLQLAMRRGGRPDLFICAGDMVERPADRFWNQMFVNTDGIRQSIPVLNVTGNHDYLKGVVGKLERRFSLVYSYFLDSEIGHDEGSPTAGSQVFTTTVGNVQFFCLDANRELPYLLRQKEWLARQLEHSTAQWRIVVLHHPLYSTRGSLNNIIQRHVFDDLLRLHRVDAVLQGHEHAYARHFDLQADSLLASPLYVISHCSPKNYRIHFYDRFSKYGLGDHYFQTLRTRGDTLSFVAHCIEQQPDGQLVASTYDSITIVKDAHLGASRIADFGHLFAERVGHGPNEKDKKFRQRVADYRSQFAERFRPRVR